LKNFTVKSINGGEVSFEIEFYNTSDAMGAMIGFIFVDDDGYVNFAKSEFLPFNTGKFHSIILPTGYFSVYGYDIEQDGVLHHGIAYPAVTRQSPPIVVRGTEGEYTVVMLRVGTL
jgi:hypothetical protein